MTPCRHSTRREKSFLTLLKYFLQKRFAEEAGVRTSRRDGLQYADSTAEALYSNEDSITLEDTLEDAGAAAELESVEYRDLVLYARRVILAALDGLPDGYRVTVRQTAPTKQVQGMQSGIPEDTTQPQRRIKT